MRFGRRRRGPAVLQQVLVRAGAAEPQALPNGVEIHAMRDHHDDRGTFREIYRQTWSAQAPPVQWNMVHSEANVLRGVHAHVRHVDYITMAMGEMILGLHDPRRGSSSYGRSVLLRLEASDPHLVVVPPAVCHGFYFAEPAMHIYGVSEGWDGTDEFGCRWDEDALGLGWPCDAPRLSARDRSAGSYAELCEVLREHGVG
jgi:dTDP-4-dehydrorhamnose 3,5-epimerase